SPGIGDNNGVRGEGSSGSFSGTGINSGIYGKINNFGAAIDAGVYGSDGGFGSGYWAGYFDGDINVNGSGICSGSWTGSDRRFKKDILQLKNVTEKIQKLNGYTYNFRSSEFKEKRFDDRTHIGFIAQELKEVFPELVKADKDGFYAV